ncbi:MAG: SpoIIE family protein phosphatase [Bacteroidales bacterium]|nr:SpoIIE family protein phosphatase [Bacteroidales bacterium]
MNRIFLILLLSLYCFSIQSQTYQFKVLSTENTNIYPYIYAIHQDSLGYLWIGTGDGLFLYDGNILTSIPLTFITGDNFITSIAIDNKGNSYVGLNNGTVAYKQGQKFYLIKETLQLKSTINQMDFYDDELWIAVQNKGIYVLKNHKLQSNPILIPNVQIYCFLKYHSHLLIGTSDGLYIYSQNKLEFASQFPQTKIECIRFNPYTNTIFAGTEEEGMIEFTIKNNTLKIVKNYAFLNNIKDITIDSEGNLWIATLGEGIFFYRRNVQFNSFAQEVQFNTENGLPNNLIRKLFIDKEKNLWIGSYGSGLFQYYESAFNVILSKINEKDVSFTSVFAHNDFLYAASEHGEIFKIHTINTQNYEIIKINELLNYRITALFIDNQNYLWIGTEEKGLYVLDLLKQKIIHRFVFEDKLLNNISSIDGFGFYHCIGTKNGLIIINTEKQPFYQEVLTTVQGLPHNYINHVLCDLKGQIWISTPTNFITRYQLENKKIILDKINLADIIKVSAMCLDNKRQLWLATYGNGIYKIDSVITNYTSYNGLFSDYTYSIIADENGTIWVGHRQGISSIKGNTIRTFSKNIGFFADCNPNAISIDKNGSIWFGTTRGLLRYNYKKSIINKIPPTVTLTSIKINDIEHIITPRIELESGRYKIQLTFTGISLRESEGVTFRYMLEGYDATWSEITTNRTVLYPRLEEGTYIFKVIAYNYDGIPSAKPYTLTIKILPPFYKRWWFILVSILTIIYGFYIILKIRERNHKRMEKILKEKLDQRTKEVVRQKELIERKNKDITDSIQYAKRIQEAILPSLSQLQQFFPQSFVIYMPRDIVSGDFYMFQPKDNKFIIICADATGHGVPGAFMSLISSTILKDILHTQTINKPSELLYKLDYEISQIFNRENSETQDGLDLSVCIYNPTQKTLLFGAAMRPLLVFHNNQWVYYKGSRYSIGISKYQIKKEFEDIVIQLEKGDRFYMFTDGLPDQFSTDNKKLKVSRLIHWIEEVQPYSMKEQLNEINKKLLLWKGDQHQIDDILLIGVEV